MIIPVDLGPESYEIVLEAGCLRKAGSLLNLDRKVLVVTDDGVPEGYAAAVAAQCRDPLVVTLPQGEATKSMDSFERLLLTMLENHFSRKDCVVAVGGGVIGDLSGFSAACYMRGIDFYNIPTTVLSQVDSSIGGKTAIDFHGYKNMVGAFWQPKKVLIDPDTLQTLPQRQISNGLAEAVKMALTFDADAFAVFEQDDPMQHLEKIIEGSLRIKKSVVEKDEKEAGLRKVLNFGHTIGHGIESCAPELYHGECVAIGMLPMCSKEVRKRLCAVLRKLQLPETADVCSSDVLEALSHDKKSNGMKVTVVLCDEIGTYRLETVETASLMQRVQTVCGR